MRNKLNPNLPFPQILMRLAKVLSGAKVRRYLLPKSSKKRKVKSGG